jgi:hypothetical protein
MKKILILSVLILSFFYLRVAHAVTIYGGYTFDDKAFADQATNLDTGSISLAGGATDVNDALSGFSPTKGIFNIGVPGRSNHFQLDFTDLYAVNNPGDDIVFFEARYSSDPYQISVREVGNSFTRFINYGAGDFVDTGATAIRSSTAYALAFDLSDFELSSGAEVDAMQFRALQNSDGITEGDPVMAGVLNSGAPEPVPEPTTMLLFGTGLLGLIGFGRKKFFKRN